MAAIPTLSFLLLLTFFSSPLLVSSDPGKPTSNLCNADDKKTLLRLSAAWGGYPSWDDAYACCDWYGVFCDDATGRVNALGFVTNPLIVGPIPPAVGDFPFLTELALHKLPNLTGPIPPALAKLKRLRNLFISWTAVSGPVPAFLSKLPALEQLDLSFNHLSGSIPASLGELPSCSYIDISRNNLTGTIPTTLFRRAPATQQPSLLLSHNGLTGEIPRAFGSLNFTQFDVSRNRLTGDASFLFGASKGLFTLDLSRNELEFDLSEVEFPETERATVTVYLDHNKIYGGIPAQIINSTDLSYFNVSYNRLCGEIPTGGQMSQFDASSYIHNKCLCGAPLMPCK